MIRTVALLGVLAARRTEELPPPEEAGCADNEVADARDSTVGDIDHLGVFDSGTHGSRGPS